MRVDEMGDWVVVGGRKEVKIAGRGLVEDKGGGGVRWINGTIGRSGEGYKD